jgi:hypothetical protein
MQLERILLVTLVSSTFMVHEAAGQSDGRNRILQDNLLDRLVGQRRVERTMRGRTTSRLAKCPPPGDTLSLLQPGDSAFNDAKSVTSFLDRRGFTVRCVTRSVMTGTAGVGKVAGFQTDRGTVTVFFVPLSERFHASSIRTDHGYRITYSKAGQHPAHVVVRSNGPEYFFQRSGWIFSVLTAQLAETLGKALDS